MSHKTNISGGVAILFKKNMSLDSCKVEKCCGWTTVESTG